MAREKETDLSDPRWEPAHLMNGQAVVVLSSLRDVELLVEICHTHLGALFEECAAALSQHQGRKMAHNFSLGRNHHAWNKDKGS